MGRITGRGDSRFTEGKRGASPPHRGGEHELAKFDGDGGGLRPPGTQGWSVCAAGMTRGCRPALTVCRGAEQRGEERQEQRGRRAHGRRRSAPRTAPLRARRRRRRPERRPPIPGTAEEGGRNAPSAAHTNPRIGGGLSPPPPQPPPPAVMLRARRSPIPGTGRGGGRNARSEALANSRDE